MRKTKHYDLVIDGEIDITVKKWWCEDEINSEYECDYEIDDEDEAKDAFEKLYGVEVWEEKWDELTNYINELE